MSLNTRHSDNSFVAHAAPPLFQIIDVKDRRLLFPIIIIVLCFPDWNDAISALRLPDRIGLMQLEDTVTSLLFLLLLVHPVFVLK